MCNRPDETFYVLRNSSGFYLSEYPLKGFPVPVLLWVNGHHHAVVIPESEIHLWISHYRYCRIVEWKSSNQRESGARPD
jgi:hypothetical protein